MLLLDEPLGALDLKLRREMQIELQQLQRDVGITFVFVTHDQEEALTMSDRIAVFNDGRIEQVATPAELYESPASSFVAGFVGTSNLITGERPGVVVGRDGSFSIRPEKIQLVGTGRLHRPAHPAGIIEAVVYLGSVNHYVVELDGGGTLTVLRQNLHGTSDQRPATEGDRVGLGWADEHVIDLLHPHHHRLGTPTRRNRMRRIRTLAGRRPSGFALAASLAACGTDDGERGDGDGQAAEEQGGFVPPDLPMAEELGENEGTLSVLAWPGYAEDGSTDKAVDWVTPFEEETGCEVSVKYFGTSDEAVTLMKSGQYDVVSASGDATLRMIAAGDVAPVNTDLIPNYADEWDFLKDRAWNSVNGQMYGVPHGYGANLLMYNTEVVKPGPHQLERGLRRRRRLQRQGDGVRLADLHRRRRAVPDDDPAGPRHRGPLRPRRRPAGRGRRPAEGAARARGRVLVGLPQGDPGLQHRRQRRRHDWQVIANLAQAEKAPVEAILPEEGATGWSDTWMISVEDRESRTAPTLWLNHIISPEANAAVAEWFGEAPANTKACDLTAEGFCEQLPRRRRGLRRPDPLLDDADRAVPRRAHGRDVHDVPGVDPGLDRDQGLSPVGRGGPSRPVTRPLTGSRDGR